MLLLRHMKKVTGRVKYPERGSYEKEGSSDFWWTVIGA